ncbi:MAG TPA: HAD hydrolase-like protein [Candidatus Kapabacteria bacterium]|nr:HAD hydrolase-like protein [Candidatus Kapabacteria bacterium]
MKKYLVLFDIDGTILNFAPNLAKELILELLQDYFNKNISESVIPDFQGMTDLQIIKSIAKEIGYSLEQLEDSIPKFWKALSDTFERHTNSNTTKILPGVSQLVKELSELPFIELGLLTGNIHQNAYHKLRAVKLDSYFKFGAFGCDSHDRNELAPIAINRANNYFDATIFNHKNTLIIGDTYRDEECARVNNIKFVCVATGKQSYEALNQLVPDAIFHDFSNVDLVKSTIIKLLYEKDYHCN